MDDTTSRLERIERQLAALVAAMEPAEETGEAQPFEDLVSILSYLADAVTDMRGEIRSLRSTGCGLSRTPADELSIAA